MTTPARLLIVGGDAGGMTAAAQARRRAGPDELEIVAFERGHYTSYSACGLPYFVAGIVDDTDRLIARSPAEHRERGIDVRLRHEVVEVDTGRATVRVRDLDAGTERDEPYDHLLVATGATPIRPDLPGIDAAGIHGIQTLGDGLALRAHVDSHDDERAVVVGGGYVGLEMAEAMAYRGLRVTVIDQAPQPMSTLDPDMGAHVADAMRGIGIDVRTGERVQGFESAGGHVAAVVTDQRTYPTHLVVLGIGVRPATSLAEAAGLAIGPSGGIAVTPTQRTSAERVWAAGDCVEVFDRVARRPTAIALGTHANKQGRVVGINVTGGYLTFPGVVGTAITKVCDLEVARAGLRARDVADLGLECVTTTIDATTRASYLPDAQPITVKLLAERRSGRLLGGQIVGREGAAKRIDAIALALWNEMTVEELSQVDLAYAPPFSPVWDPVLIAARKCADAAA